MNNLLGCSCPQREIVNKKKGCVISQLPQQKVGVLISNLGSPAAPTRRALRKYLKQFLGDKRVIEVPRALWWLILNGIILNVRPQRSARLYARVWRHDGAPLLSITRSLVQKLQNHLQEENVVFEFGMRYGTPSNEEAIDRLLAQGVEKIILAPLYPQYCAATTGSTYDSVFHHLLARRWIPPITVVPSYFARAGFIRALANSINREIETFGTPDRLLLSYHGIPVRYAAEGDPYCCMCLKTTELLIPLLNLPKEKIVHPFQSRFGKEPWLQPYTDISVEALATEGVQRILVACPGFSADCLETIDEIGNELAHTFIHAGGAELKLIPCLNDSDEWIQVLGEIIKEHF